MSQNKDSEKSFAFIIVFLMMAMGFYFLFFGTLEPSRNSTAQDSGHSMELSSDLPEERRTLPSSVEDSINRQLKNAQQSEDRGRQRVYWENLNSAPSIQAGELDSRVFIDEKPPHPIRIEQYGPANEIAEQIRSNQRMNNISQSPAELIGRRIVRDQWLKEYDARYEAEYVRQFLENARAQGYEINLNENLEIIGIHEIQKEEPLRFPNSIRGEDSN